MFRNSSDPKHNHIKEDLHVEITSFASPAEANNRLAFALTEMKKIPHTTDSSETEEGYSNHEKASK